MFNLKIFVWVREEVGGVRDGGEGRYTDCRYAKVLSLSCKHTATKLECSSHHYSNQLSCHQII